MLLVINKLVANKVYFKDTKFSFSILYVKMNATEARSIIVMFAHSTSSSNFDFRSTKKKLRNIPVMFASTQFHDFREE